MAQEIVTYSVETASREMVNSPMAPSAMAMSSMDTLGLPWSAIVASPVARPSAMTAPEGAVNATVNVSSGSGLESVIVSTAIVRLLTPSGNDRAPLSDT